MTKQGTWDPEVFFQIVHARRSVRSFKPDPVPEDDVRRILDAARLAPTSGNQQPWRFLVIRDRDKLDRLHDEALTLTLEAVRDRLVDVPPDEVQAHRARIESYLAGMMSAPLYVAILLDTTSPYPSYNVEDGALAAAHLMLAARALGYGTAYTTDAVPKTSQRRIFDIPERYEILCLIPIGVPERWPERPVKKELDQVIAWEEIG